MITLAEYASWQAWWASECPLGPVSWLYVLID